MALQENQPVKMARGNLCVPISLISVEHQGVHNAMTAAWVSPTSFEPLLINISLGITRYTHELIMKSGQFAINILADDQMELAVYCGNISGREVDKFAEGKIETRPARKISAPLINGCVANIECVVRGYFLTGDHTVFSGESVHYDEDPDKTPLIRYRGDFYSLSACLGADAHPAKV
jgi:flavin reductase (DIM6/NTAB) family NADH-FMN oxidoreductase RutF